MKKEGYEEISEEEYSEIPNIEKGGLMWDEQDKVHHFKKAQKFPIVFEDDNRKFKVIEGAIIIEDKITKEDITICYSESFPLLLKAVKKIEEVMKKNEK